MHSLVYIILPKGTTDYEEYIDNILGSTHLDKSRQFPSYKTLCSCRSRVALNNAFEKYDNSKEGKELLKKLVLSRKRSERKTEQLLLEKRFKAVQNLEEKDPQYGQLDPDCKLCFGNGYFENSCNPRDSYDWWVIGGRWDCFFDSISTKIKNINSDLKGNIAIVSEVIGSGLPPAIITPDGHLFEGPIIMDTFNRNVRSWEEEELNQWNQRAESILNKYFDCAVVVVDCHS